ncbi:hypothetical protein AVEN_21460-1 [Araneus ventricosus]|uniref:Uncharacterized protein n=1 Tax=Araneus ventricosus TaxID=182803 RepID=A0A4Y2WA42_ARAVE|nr:hypothetical protein AVEN_21460-1 [Araneus ventricosus]
MKTYVVRYVTRVAVFTHTTFRDKSTTPLHSLMGNHETVPQPQPLDPFIILYFHMKAFEFLTCPECYWTLISPFERDISRNQTGAVRLYNLQFANLFCLVRSVAAGSYYGRTSVAEGKVSY